MSLSGGVDSVSILHYMNSVNNNKYNLNAIFIQYNNKDDKEENFVKYLCYKHQIPLFIKRIVGLKRNRTEFRDLYE